MADIDSEKIIAAILTSGIFASSQRGAVSPESAVDEFFNVKAALKRKRDEQAAAVRQENPGPGHQPEGEYHPFRPKHKPRQ